MKLPSMFLTECKIGGHLKRGENDLFKRFLKLKIFAPFSF